MSATLANAARSAPGKGTVRPERLLRPLDSPRNRWFLRVASFAAAFECIYHADRDSPQAGEYFLKVLPANDFCPSEC